MKAFRRVILSTRRVILSAVEGSLLLLALAACDFRPLQDTGNVSYVRVYVDDALLNVTQGFYDDHIREETHGEIDVHFVHPAYARPEILRVGLFDTSTGELIAERYLRNQGDDERGHYYDGYVVVNPGTYNLVAYNFGTESTIVGDEYNCFSMYAYTNEIAASLKSKFKSRTKTDEGTKAEEDIRYDADHLFVARAVKMISDKHQGVDTLHNANGQPWFEAETVVKSYYLQIGVIGAQYIASASCLLTGMAASTHLLEPDFEQADETTIYFEMQQGAWPDGYKPGRKDYRCIYTTFGTFGCLPDVTNELKVSLEFVTSYGAQIDTTFNISPEFLKADAIDHQWLLPDFEVKIPDPPDPGPSGGGMAPSVDEWGEVHSEFEI